MAKSRQRAITFIKSVTPYKEGEVATFDEELAGKYIDQKFAQHHSWIGDEPKEEPKSDPKKTEEKKEGDK